MKIKKLLFKKRSILPGFSLTLGFTIFYLTIIVLTPLALLFWHTASLSLTDFLHIISEERVVHAYKITFGISFLATLINCFFGFIVAWVLVRYQFPGKKIIDALVDLPFAVPTAVSGIALAALYSESGWIGSYLAEFGIKISYTSWGIAVALVFVGLPFVVRTVEPVLQDLNKETEEAASSLGANRLQTFCRVTFPQIFPSLLTGFAMAFSRALGEYGSVIFIAGNMPYVSEIVPLIIVIKLEQYDYSGATAIALIMLLSSFVMLFVINSLQKWNQKRREG